MKFSEDQAQAFDAIANVLKDAGVDIENGTLLPASTGKTRVLAVLGKAGSGKTMLLSKLVQALNDAGVETISPDFESTKRKDKRSLAILAPTNKAASVLRSHGVPATTIHRIIYTPLYDPEYEKIAEWLEGADERPDIEGLTDAALDRAFAFYQTHKSIPGALAAAGLRGSDFITGWSRRDDPLDIGFIDESSMIDDKQLEDLREIFSTLIMFGDPAQLAPVMQSGNMSFDRLPEDKKLTLHRIHRQEAGNPILDLAHALGDPKLDFPEFERMIEAAAAKDDRIIVTPRVDATLMARSPVLVWRNATRIRLIHAFGEGGDEHALAFFFADVDFAEQIVHLGADGADFDKRVDQAGGAHHLLHHLAGVLFFVFGGGGRHKHRLRHDAFEFGEFERAVVAGAGQAEAVIHQVLLAAGIAFIHAADLGHGNVALVDKHNRIFGQIVHQRGWRLALFFAGKMAAVVFNAFAKAHFIEHFQVETGALLDALGFDGAVFLGVEGHAFAQFFFDALTST